jgi:hypothetical protein
MAARDHAKPTPKKTFTELLPVTLPIDESAYSSWTAAHLLANVSGKGKKKEFERDVGEKQRFD